MRRSFTIDAGSLGGRNINVAFTTNDDNKDNDNEDYNDDDDDTFAERPSWLRRSRPPSHPLLPGWGFRTASQIQLDIDAGDCEHVFHDGVYLMTEIAIKVIGHLFFLNAFLFILQLCKCDMKPIRYDEYMYLLSTADTDGLMLYHQSTGSHSTDYPPMRFQLFMG